MERTFAQTASDLRMLLRDEPPDTTADVTDGAVVFLCGNELRGVFLSIDEAGGLDSPFDVDEFFVGQVEDSLADWFRRPRFTHRPSLQAWEVDAPPCDRCD